MLADGLVVAERALTLAENSTTLDRAAAAPVTCFFLYRTGATERTITFGEAMMALLKAEAMHAAYAEMLRWVRVCACDSGLFSIAIKRASEGYRLADEMNDQRSRVLAQVAKLLSEHTRTSDIVTRTGGEEFVLVMPGTSAPDAFDICERLRLRVSDYGWTTIAPDLRVAVSAGIASAPDYDAAMLLERADLAMYRAKRAGRNRIAVAA